MNLTAEIWLAECLQKHGVPWAFDGLTSREDRRNVIRGAIMNHGLSAVVAGKNRDGKPQTYAQCFEQVYEEPLK
jgi:hypothetical protein